MSFLSFELRGREGVVDDDEGGRVKGGDDEELKISVVGDTT